METSALESVAQAQLQSLDDTDTYASSWNEALATAESNTTVLWGGRGRGGRGLSRCTFQPSTIVVGDVTLHYVGDRDSSLPNKLLLDAATLKLLPGKVYSLVGRNGAGKSTLLRRIQSGKIPGFPPHIETLYIPQEVLLPLSQSPIEIVLSLHDTFFKRSEAALRAHVELLENELDALDPQDTDSVEKLCQHIALLEEELQSGHDVQIVQKQAEEALRFFGIDKSIWNIPCSSLSGGQRKKISLSTCLFCRFDLLLLDEPTNYLDIEGLLQLRRLIQSCKERNSTVIMVSHDVDLINDVATDVIHMHHKKLVYYPGTYRDFIGYLNQNTLHSLRQNAALQRKREHMVQTIHNLKKQSVPVRGATKKRGQQISTLKKKLDKLGVEKDEHGHRWTAQSAGTGIREGSINSVGASTRAKLSCDDLLKITGISVAPLPDKAVQFVFRDTNCTFGEPLIIAMDVGFKYDMIDGQSSRNDVTDNKSTKQLGFLFDCVDMCMNEGTISCILGANGCGKTTLLRLLAKQFDPTEGSVRHAHGVNVAYFDQHVVDELVESTFDQPNAITPLSLLVKHYPKKSEQELRGELTNFGLDPTQAQTKVKFLSGGERTRLCLACLMLSNPDVILMDEPTSHLDVESVEALVYGLSQWNGTVALVSHDANLIRSLESRCYVIMEKEGKLRTIPHGIDFYLRSFKL